VRTVRRELLDHLLIFGRRHLEQVLREFVQHYQHERPHQSLAQRPPSPPEPRAGPQAGQLFVAIAWAASSMSSAGLPDAPIGVS